MGVNVNTVPRWEIPTERVKAADFHSSQSWILLSLFTGSVMLIEYELGEIIWTLEVLPGQPCRCCKFLPQTNWFAVGCDDYQIRIYHEHSMDLIVKQDAHSDFIRGLATHMTEKLLLSSSDDRSINLWSYEDPLILLATFEGHIWYVMDIQFHHTSHNVFASGSLDSTIKLWNCKQFRAGQTAALNVPPTSTLTGHADGVMSICFIQSQPTILVSSSDDKTIGVWDIDTKQLLQTLRHHSGPVNRVIVDDALRLIFAVGEDKQLSIWDANTYNMEQSIQYNCGRLWAQAHLQGTHSLVIGGDNSVVFLTLSKEESAACISGNRLYLSHGPEITVANLSSLADAPKPLPDDVTDLLPKRSLGHIEVFPRQLRIQRSGKFLSVCGNNQFVIYSSQALRTKLFGSAESCAWSRCGHYFAVRTKLNKVTLYKDFKEHTTFQCPVQHSELFCGPLLALKGSEKALYLYNWHSGVLERKFDLPSASDCDLAWRDDLSLLALLCSNTVFFIKIIWASGTQLVEFTTEQSNARKTDVEEFSSEVHSLSSVAVIREVPLAVKKLLFIGDSLIALSALGQVHLLSLTDQRVIGHFPSKALAVAGYAQDHNCLILASPDRKLIAVPICKNFLEFRLILNESIVFATDVMNSDEESQSIEELCNFRGVSPITCEKFGSLIPLILDEFKYMVVEVLQEAVGKAHVPEVQRRLNLLAYKISEDPDILIELAIKLSFLDKASELLERSSHASSDTSKWRSLGNASMREYKFATAVDAFLRAKDYSSVILVYAAAGDINGLEELAKQMEALNNIPYVIILYVLIGKTDKALDILLKNNNFAVSAIFARTYLPSRLQEVREKWIIDLQTISKKYASAIDVCLNTDQLTEAIKLEKAVKNLYSQELGPLSTPTDILDIWKLSTTEILKKYGVSVE